MTVKECGDPDGTAVAGARSKVRAAGRTGDGRAVRKWMWIAVAAIIVVGGGVAVAASGGGGDGSKPFLVTEAGATA